MKKRTLFSVTVILFAMIYPTLLSYAETVPSVSSLPDDTKINITSAVASVSQPGEGVNRSYDGDNSTLWHSPWGGTSEQIILTYNIQQSDLDYAAYTTRSDNNTNGNFKRVKVYVKTTTSSNFEIQADVNLNGVAGTHRIPFTSTIQNATAVRFVVLSALSDKASRMASCAEMEFYKKGVLPFDVLTYFTDATCSELKAGITTAQINSIPNDYYKALATSLFANTYKKEFRMQSYKAWPDPGVFSWKNRVGHYSKCDNPTGIYIREGEEIAVFAEDLHGYRISLCLKNLDKPGGDGYWDNTYYNLYKGTNKIVADRDGLFYVMYHTEDHLTAPEVKIHFAFAKENGYYNRQKHSAADWTRLLNATEYKFFDVLGQYAHLTFPTEKFKNNCPNDGNKLIEAYDDLVFLEREHMGYYKYPNRNPYNRSHFTVMYKAYMYSAENHTAYNENTLDGLTSFNGLKKGPWGPAHEVGHSNQHHPLMLWVGLTEVTNNIHSAYVQTKWGNTSRLTNENRYQEGFNDIIAGGIPHCKADIWRKLVPFWQLQLFFADVLGKEDFYSAIYEGARTRTLGNNDGEHQLNFVRLVCDSAKIDLTDFFEAWGFLKPVDADVEDYWTARVTITENQANSVKNYIKKYNKQPYAVQYLTDNNVPIYKGKKKVVKGNAVRFGTSYKMKGWENVVAFEGWQGDQLVTVKGNLNVTNSLKTDGNVSLSGTFNESITKVYAVQYDGTKIEIIPDLEVNTTQPTISTADNETWYFVKNMSNENVNSESGTPRGYNALYAPSENNTVRGTMRPLSIMQRWKLVSIGEKVGLVNEDGLYLGENMKATTTPYGWKLEELAQGGSSGFRFANYSATHKLTTVAHLSLSGNLMNWINPDEASLWQFIPANEVKFSTTANTHFYKFQTLRYDESSLLGAELSAQNVTNSVGTKIKDGAKWKIVENGFGVYIQEEGGKYLNFSGSTSQLSDNPQKLYLYLTTAEGVVGYRIASATYETAKNIDVKDDGTIGVVTKSDITNLWKIYDPLVSSVTTNIRNISTVKAHIYVENGKIVIPTHEKFNVYTITGALVSNKNLRKGIYIIQTKDFVTKVLVN